VGNNPGQGRARERTAAPGSGSGSGSSADSGVGGVVVERTTTTNVRGKGEPVVAKRNVLNELLRGALVILARRGETTEGKFVEENIFF